MKLIKRLLVIGILACVCASCTSSVRFTSVRNGAAAARPVQSNKTAQQSAEEFDGDYDETGMASYYGDEFDGRQTASGDTFDQNELTAAHNTLPFGTRVTVTNLSNGRSVTVRINDRGPFAAGRIIDLSRAAAESLGMIESGTTRVRVVAK